MSTMQEEFGKIGLYFQDHPDVHPEEDVLEVYSRNGETLILGTDSYVWSGPSSSLSGSRDDIAREMGLFVEECANGEWRWEAVHGQGYCASESEAIAEALWAVQ